MLLMSVLSSVAWPCAGLFHDVDALAESDAQMVLFEAADGGVRVSYQVDYEGDADAFGWLIPVFGEFAALEEASDTLFPELYSHTQPSVDAFYSSEGDGSSLGCGGVALKGGDVDGDRGYDTASPNSIDVIAEGFTGSYSYSVLESDNSEAFLAWLDDNGWSTGGAEAAIDAYIKEGGVQFVAIGLTEAGGGQLPPLSITYSGDQMRFPATLGRNGMADHVRTVVFVRGEGTATLSGGWDAEDIDVIHGSLGDDPSSLYDDALLAIGGIRRGYGVVYSGPDPDSGWLTRFETLAEPSAHIEDAWFDVTGGQSSFRASIRLAGEGDAGSYGWLLLPVVALGAGAARRRLRWRCTALRHP